MPQPLIDPTDPELRNDALSPTMRAFMRAGCDPLTQKAMDLEQKVRETKLLLAGAEKAVERHEANGDDDSLAIEIIHERCYRDLLAAYERQLKSVRLQMADRAAMRQAAAE